MCQVEEPSQCRVGSSVNTSSSSLGHGTSAHGTDPVSPHPLSASSERQVRGSLSPPSPSLQNLDVNVVSVFVLCR